MRFYLGSLHWYSWDIGLEFPFYMKSFSVFGINIIFNTYEECGNIGVIHSWKLLLVNMSRLGTLWRAIMWELCGLDKCGKKTDFSFLFFNSFVELKCTCIYHNVHSLPVCNSIQHFKLCNHHHNLIVEYFHYSLPFKKLKPISSHYSIPPFAPTTSPGQPLI